MTFSQPVDLKLGPMDLEFSTLFTRPLHSIKRRGYVKFAETILELRNESTLLVVFSKLIINKFFKGFTNHSKKTNRAVIFRRRAIPKIFQLGQGLDRKGCAKDV